MTEDKVFNHSDRLPTSSPLPQGWPTTVPWGVQRMAPYPALAPSYARAEIDGVTQTARYFDAGGHVMEMPGHGTSTGTNPATNTGNPSGGGGSGGGDQDTGNDNDQ